MLEVSRLARCYGQFKAVNDVSFSINKGEIVGLLGHNGAGKTTIMKMLSGFLEPDTGEIRLDHIDVVSEPEKAQQFLGYLPENLPIYPELVVADYLDYVADLKSISRQHKASEIQRVIIATELGEKLLAPVSTLSRGFKQRLGVAQAILGKPKLLILDEPTNGLDPEQTEHMRQLIREIARDATVILSTHIMQEVDALCSRVLILRAGNLAIDKNLEELQRTNHLLVESTIPEKDFRALLPLTGLDSISLLGQNGEGGVQRYRVAIASAANSNSVASQLSRTIVEGGYDLIRMQAEHRDLETLFIEVNRFNESKQEVEYAA